MSQETKYKRIRIFPFKLGSQSAQSIKSVLKDDTNVLLVKEAGKYKPKSGDLIINWGNSKRPQWLNDNSTLLNDPVAVAKAINKIVAFQILNNADVPTVDYTADVDDARQWIDNGETVIGRAKVNGSKGDGIVVLTDDNIDGMDGTKFPRLPLYTRLVPKAREYRLHVFNGKVIDMQQKKRRRVGESDETQDGIIKNLTNNWVFTRENITPPPEKINQVAIDAVKALGLDFAGVDILSKDGEVYVLELNTAIGLEGRTLQNYVDAIKEYATR